MGRPTNFDQDKANAICARLASGETLARICNDPDMPAQSTVYSWLRQNEAFLEAYSRAREDQADKFAEDIATLHERHGDNPNLGQLEFKAKSWLAAKLRPSRYSDRQQVELSGTITLADVQRDAAAILASRVKPGT